MLKRLRLALADLTEDDEHHSVTIAARELCKLADIALSVFTQAIKALKERNLVTVRHGGNRRQSAYQVNFFKTICASNLDAPPLENTALVRAALASDFDATTLSLIDHVFSAKPRRWPHSYMAKCGRNAAGNRCRIGNPPPPPTAKDVAQLLSIADERSVTRALEHLLTEAHEPYIYFWFVATPAEAGRRRRATRQAIHRAAHPRRRRGREEAVICHKKGPQHSRA
jgi:hypothetical protein